MKKLSLKLISYVLAFVLVFCNVEPLTAYAAPSTVIKTDAGSEQKTLSGLSITDLDEPSIGVPFDGTATVRSAEGVAWEIPVIWTDEDGNIAIFMGSGTSCCAQTRGVLNEEAGALLKELIKEYNSAISEKH